jgi:predicted HTH domain antitoxin
MLHISIPETIILSTRQTSKEFESEAKKAIALKFYADEKLSLGQAAELAEISKFDFMKYLGANRIPLFRFEDDDYVEQLQKDVKNAGKYVHANE